MKKTTYFWRKGLWALLSLFFLFLVGASLLYLYLESQLPNVDSLKTVQLQVPLRIYTQDGLLIQEYGEKKRIPVNYEDIPPTLIHAVLATEDQRFFDHPGVDVFGLARATVRMIQTGTKSQGGSTITMQVARNFFLNRKKTFLRKFNEILLAIKIDRELSKEKILELYLNKIYLGNRAYGVGAAAQVYFGKPLKELNLSQLAMIAGLPQAPSTQNPIANPAAAKKRRDHVLERLLEEKYITEAQYHEAINEPVTVAYHGATLEINAPYVAEMIRQSLYDHFGPDAYTKGYKVYTTIKAPLQKTANTVIEENLLAYDRRHGYRGPVTNVGKINPSAATMQNVLAPYSTVGNLQPALVISMEGKEATVLLRNGNRVILPWEGMSWARPALRNGWMGKAPTQAKQIVTSGDVIYVRFHNDKWQLAQIPQVEGALVALNPKSGAIEALVGGFDFQRSKFNRATQSTRQPGSSFKPFIYAAALNKGYTLATLVNDAPIVVDDPSQANLWRPHNDNRTFNGPTRLKEGLVRSRNLVSIRILDDIGIDYAVTFITHFGFNKKSLPHALSLALGSLSVSPMELTAAYAVFANGGYKIEPYLIDHITDNDGKILLQAKPTLVCEAQCEDKNVDPDNLAPRVIPADIAFLMNSALKGVVQHGTASQARVLNRQDIAGKTGTTNDQVDAWFAGYNADLVVTTWVGYDTPHSLHEYAASLALPMWIDFMKVALQGKPEHELKQPDNVVAVRIDPTTGLLAPSNQANAIIEYFREEEIPGIEEGSSTTTSSEEEVAENLF
ncbi:MULTISPECIES: penicillin-binding protein 1A [Legionella]|uniref:Penicillin-binding protein 1A n=1 Tax=Legionella septentrionalis TaxID=2498109 RepID=A0A433JKP9_9GAMM|nr:MULTISPECIES: penicillin-binding protein 1A [Legionella]MCP0914482.1 penicillin-binding protein 1A [Legionella sp. 27cVA30]RUQ89456.1 penicillin-binding protein 1A [Legionella septentrionalis]RUQ95588.1 penicillin-binding protein 1A [Legionella septentrionalis]RUR10469.1 penicillin-binding protein 1A [Legionella septentrionalis]RUR16089.1 penicillin-binding protein 1A [Legionella septentrionalis]